MGKTDIPEFLRIPGTEVLLRNRHHLKLDPLVQKVQLVETISPHFSRIQFPDGRVDTVSTRDLAPTANGDPHDAPQMDLQGASPKTRTSEQAVSPTREDVAEVRDTEGTIIGPDPDDDQKDGSDHQPPLMGIDGRTWTDIDTRNIIHGPRLRRKM